MPNELSLPLLDIIKRASRAPAEGIVAQRMARFRDTTEEVCVLVDCSSSMSDWVGNTQRTKWDHARYALIDLVKYFPKVRIVAFPGMQFAAHEISTPRDLPEPEPCGGTPLAQAFEAVRQYRPRKTVVITDGDPDSREEAEKAAQSITGAIDVIYCGPEASPSHRWLRGLARSFGGVDVAWNGADQLACVIRLRIEAPKP